MQAAISSVLECLPPKCMNGCSIHG